MNPKHWIIKQVLDHKGPGFCLEKWGVSTMHLATGQEHGCHHCKPVKIDPDEIKDPSALFNHRHKLSVRKEMLEGKIPAECNYCHSSNGIQDRVIQSGYIYNWFNPNTSSLYSDPRSLEVSFSTVCNMSCSYCGPSYSSKWQGEIESQGEYPNGYNRIYLRPIPEREDNPYIEAFWKYWPVIKKDLRHLRITGGEPLLSKHTFTLLDQAGNIPVTINSNLSVDKEIVKKLVEYIRDKNNITIATSGESVGERAEYSRHGLDYDLFLENVKYIRENCPKVKLHIMATYNIFCVSSFTDFLKDMKEVDNKISLHVSRLTDPRFLTHKLIKEYKDESLDYISKNFSKNAFYRFQNILLDDKLENEEEIRKEFTEFVREFDKRRNLDFVKTFPEYEFLLRD